MLNLELCSYYTPQGVDVIYFHKYLAGHLGIEPSRGGLEAPVLTITLMTLKFFFQHFQALFLVLVLTDVFVALNDDACWKVSNSHMIVWVLNSSRTIGINPELGLIYLFHVGTQDRSRTCTLVSTAPSRQRVYRFTT